MKKRNKLNQKQLGGKFDDQATALHESHVAQDNDVVTAGADHSRTVVGTQETIDGQNPRGLTGKKSDAAYQANVDTRRDALTVDSVGPLRQTEPGTRPLQIAGYDVVSELGRGGMGVVYRARHRNLKRDVALKMILSGRLAGTQILKRFHAEAEAVARLQHPNIVQIFEIGSHDDQPFIALEYVEGKNLSELVREKPMLPSDAANVVMKLARAMQYAHSKNVLHRDLKPANILMAQDGTPKITDFGLAKQLDEIDSAKTSTGAIIGTPSYMSPEQAMGLQENVGPATDQYSLGAMMYALITGRPPFLSAKPLDTVSKVLHQEPLPPHKMVEGLPRDLETICLKLLQKSPAQRYGNCGELADDLQRFLNKEPILARPISRTERTIRWCKRNPRIAIPTAIAAGLLVALVALGGVSYAMIAKQRDRAEANFVLAEKNANEAKLNAEEAEKNSEIASQNEALARQSEALAQEREKDAKAQALALMHNVQYIITDVDQALANQPGSTELRIEIAERQAEVWDTIDVSVREDVQGEAIPTLMAVRFRLGQLFEQLGKIDEATAQLDKLVDTARGRIAVKGNSDAARLNLARVLIFASMMRDRYSRDPDVSLKMKEEARDVSQSIVDDPKPVAEDNPSPYMIHEVLAETTQGLGAAWMSRGQLDKSKELILQALEIRKANLERLKETSAYLESKPDGQATMMAEASLVLDKSTMGIAYTMIKQGQTEDGLRMFEETLVSREKAFRDTPAIPSLRQEYGRFAGLLGECLMWSGRMEQAREKLDVSVAEGKEFAKSEPGNVELQRQYSIALHRRASLNGLSGDEPASTADAGECLKLREKIFAKTAGVKDEADLVMTLAWLGKADEAKPILEKIAALEQDDPELQLKCARAWSSLASNAEGPERESFRTRAMETLTRAITEGFSDPYKVRVEAEFQWLKDTPEFVAIVEGIGK